MFNGLPILVRSYRCPCGGACLFIEVIPIEHRKYEVPEHHINCPVPCKVRCRVLVNDPFVVMQ